MNCELYSYMPYIYTRKNHKEDILVWESSLKESSIRGSSPNEKLPFSLMSEGERFITCMERDLDAWRESTEACFQED
jgi:hypothetical protein